MALLNRIRADWTGFSGGPGVSTFYTSGAAPDLAPFSAFFVSLGALLAGGVSVSMEPSGDVLESATGLLTGSWSAAGAAPSVSTNAQPYAAPVGASVRWNSDYIRAGRRLKGRTYLVPLAGNVFETNGTLTEANRTIIRDAANALVTAVPTLSVWGRPRPAVPAWTDSRGNVHAAKPAVAGSFGNVTSASVRDVAAVLTSRRD